MKLSKDHKDVIFRMVLEKTFKEREDALKAESSALAQKGYSDLYPAEVVAKMDRLPDSFFHQTSSIHVYHGGDKKTLKLISSRKVAAIDNQWKRPLWEPSKKDMEAVSAHFKKAEKLETDINQTKSELRCFLDGISTTNKLKEIWPEGEEFYSWIFKTPPKNPLAIRPDAINQLLTQMKAAN